MDFIAKHHGAVISFLVGNGNVYSYKHNGVEHHIIFIRMPPSTQATHTQMSLCFPPELSATEVPGPLQTLLLPSSSRSN